MIVADSDAEQMVAEWVVELTVELTVELKCKKIELESE